MSSRRTVSLASLVLAALLSVAVVALPGAAQAEVEQSSVELGRQIYRSGELPSGAEMRATVIGDISLPGTQATCMSCHGRSGLGYGETDQVALAVTGTRLYQARTMELYRPEARQGEGRRGTRATGPGTRPAYTDETLARSIRDGIDAAGRPLDPLMPRYDLSDDDVGHLVAYLKTLSTAPAPGVTDTHIHIATVVTEGVEPERRKAMIDVLQAFFEAKNSETRAETRRASSGPWIRHWSYQAYRKWMLHVWELTGPRDTWSDQLARLYEETPVFALVNGIAKGSWRPIHEFCETREIPCVLPTTDLPVVSDSDFYTVYFSAGLELEAKALAMHLRDTGVVSSGHRIVQVYRAAAGDNAPARAFRRALQSHPDAEVVDRILEGDAKPTREFWSQLFERDAPAVLVVWLRPDDLNDLDAVAGSSSALSEIYFSSTLVPDYAHAIPQSLWDKTRLTHPYALPAASARKLRPVRVWFRTKQIPITHERTQFNAYFAARVFGDALLHAKQEFFRDYVLEKLEHRVTGTVTPSLYPRISLGPGQRFLSKGCYIARPSATAGEELVVVSDWIVP